MFRLTISLERIRVSLQDKAVIHNQEASTVIVSRKEAHAILDKVLDAMDVKVWE